jgi:hypothetical protein
MHNLKRGAGFFNLHAYTSENTFLVCWRCFSRGRPAQRKELKVIITSVMNQKSALLAALAFAAVIPQAFGNPGDQRIVRDVVAAKGWTIIVPMNINNDGLTDLLSYNAVTGRAAFSVGFGTAGNQQVVRDVTAATGWTSIVPMDTNKSLPTLTGLLSYNSDTGRAAFSVATDPVPPH